MKVLAIFAMALVAGVNAGTYTDRFLEQYKKIKSSSSGYFSSDGVPYHSVETLIVEAPDQGHETTSEAYSYYVWLEAMYGAIEGDFSSFNSAWESMEKYTIPTLQNANSEYDASKPATYIAEMDDPSEYPSAIDSSIPVGQDPLADELKSAYGTSDFYSMHWLLDVDNVYGFGNVQGQCEAGSSASGPSLYNNYQRGPQESVWRTIPQPTCDQFKYGGTNGFLDLFVQDSDYSHQYKYTAAPDADARAVQAAYWANVWATEKGSQGSISQTLTKAAKMGDYLRYSLFDKYFKKIGNCYPASGCAAASGKDSAHYLISWYFAWGGSYNAQYEWSWRIGDGASHFGYQNPLAAYALANDASLKPKGSTAVDDWTKSLQRQLELYEYLQTDTGPFAGGVTNSWKGRYAEPDSDLLNDTFYGMFYDWEPVYHDPPSNRWYGMQPWSADRLAQYYYATGDSKAQSILKKWADWVDGVIQFSGDDFQIPSNLGWSGDPPNVQVTVTSYARDLGAAAATARTLAYYAAKSGDSTAKSTAKKLLDAIYTTYKDDIGFSVEEERDDYNRFNEKVYVPSGWTGTYPNGDVIDSSATFLGIRSWYKNDPNWSKVETYLNGGAVPTFKYHRFWAQADIALAFGAYGLLFSE
ncbi:exoglucanase B [Dendroctonus ponderosae]|uniref:Glycoside hydrolase family protein 48 n=2 Tax=Dendroctonus ponderosae TaxID=77166 RepID=E7CIT8_DENPD|nr:exoglucanase B [Dendroctonus ponderosae]AEE61736.1 unknown [Dendroctonus ponderosae]